MIIDYQILRADRPYSLAQLVQNQIKSGWQPLGGVSFEGFQYCQAVVKYEVEQTTGKKTASPKKSSEAMEQPTITIKKKRGSKAFTKPSPTTSQT